MNDRLIGYPSKLYNCVMYVQKIGENVYRSTLIVAKSVPGSRIQQRPFGAKIFLSTQRAGM